MCMSMLQFLLLQFLVWLSPMTSLPSTVQSTGRSVVPLTPTGGSVVPPTPTGGSVMPPTPTGGLLVDQ